MADFKTFDEVEVGDRFPETPLHFDVTADRVQGFLDATDCQSEAYAKETGAAPSMLAAVYLVELLKQRNSPPGGIHAKQSITFSRGLRVGEMLSLQAVVAKKYIRRERPYVVSEFTATDATGAVVASGKVTSIWGQNS